MSIQLKGSGSSGSTNGYGTNGYGSNGYGTNGANDLNGGYVRGSYNGNAGANNTGTGSVPPTRYSQTTVHVDDSYYYTKPKVGGLDSGTIENISELTGWILYGTYVVAALCLIGFALSGVSPDGGMAFMKLVSLILTIIVLFDAVFQVFYKKESILLLLFALILNGFYPLARGWIKDGVIETRAIVAEIIYGIGMLVFFITAL